MKRHLTFLLAATLLLSFMSGCSVGDSSNAASDVPENNSSEIKELVQSVNGTIEEYNTAYGGQRAGTAMLIKN